jgi:DNA topoisomerase-1
MSAGSALVIVESPAKAKTIEKYLRSMGSFVVEASKGHIRDLPERAEKKAAADGEPKPKRAPAKKGEKKPAEPKPMDIPGVDMQSFATTYVVTPDRRELVSKLRKLKKGASEVWFATDLDREGEAISWHIAEVLDVDPAKAKRVVFNAITKAAIEKAFQSPRAINMSRVNAQNSRRILDRIVGYGISPLLWRIMRQGGLSAGRVQTVAARLVVEREEEIREFIPTESWDVLVRLTPELAKRDAVAKAIAEFLAQRTERGAARSQKDRLAFLSKQGALEARLVEVGGREFKLEAEASGDAPRDLSREVRAAVEAAGLESVRIDVREDPKGKGAARFVRTVAGTVGAGVAYRVTSIDTERKSRRAMPPFKTSTMQMAASSELGFSTDRTMRIAQQLYEGVDIGGDRVGLITYMRTDSSHIAGEALHAVRDLIQRNYGDRYLPEKPNFWSSSENAQEAHEAIRPTNVRRTPESLRGVLEEEQWRLYSLVWQRFVACQMTDAEYDSTAVLLERSDKATGAVFKATGRVQTFDGYTVTGIRGEGEDQELPAMKEGQEMAPFWIDPQQKFTSPPSRFNEASLVRELEKQGIGRPSTYASIINTIEERKYVEQVSRAFHATDIGMAVCQFLEEPFKGGFMDVGYTRRIEEEFDEIAEGKREWHDMLGEFYAPFKSVVAGLMERDHVKAAAEPAPYACPQCGRRCEYRLGKTGRFLSCSGFNEKVKIKQPPTKAGKARKPKEGPACSYAAPVNRQGKPLLPEKVDIRCPVDGAPMVLRTGRFGDFLTSINRETEFVLNIDRKGGIKFPSPPPYVTELPCPKCGAPMNLRTGKRGPWLGCSKFPKCRGRESWAKVPAEKQQELEKALGLHEANQPKFEITALDGTPLKEGTPVAALLVPGEEAQLTIHPDAERERRALGATG